MDITINITAPVITSPEVFKYRYRQLNPTGAWSSYATEGDNSIELTGLAAGQYEIEVIFVTEDGIECPAVIYPSQVMPEPTCNEFTVTQILENGITYLNIAYTTPSPYTPFPCGYNVYYRPAGSSVPFQNKGYATLPASPIKIQVSDNTVYEVEIKGNICSNTTQCFYGEIEPPEEEPCVPMTVTSVVITPTQVMPNGDYKVLITINYTQSNPASTSHIINYTQLNVIAGQSPAQGTSTPTGLPPTNAAVSFGVLARYRDASNTPLIFPVNTISFQGTITDACGQSHYWSGSLDL